MAARFCVSCGGPLLEGARFCASCGASAPDLSQASRAAEAPAAPPPVSPPGPSAPPPTFQQPPGASTPYAAPPLPPFYPHQPQRSPLLLFGIVGGIVLLIGVVAALYFSGVFGGGTRVPPGGEEARLDAVENADWAVGRWTRYTCDRYMELRAGGTGTIAEVRPEGQPISWRLDGDQVLVQAGPDTIYISRHGSDEIEGSEARGQSGNRYRRCGPGDVETSRPAYSVPAPATSNTVENTMVSDPYQTKM